MQCPKFTEMKFKFKKKKRKIGKLCHDFCKKCKNHKEVVFCF